MALLNKIVVYIPEVKRIPLGKVVIRGKVTVIKNKAGKKLSVPTEKVLLKDSKAIWIELPRRRLMKGKFDLEKGAFVDEKAGIRINPNIIALGEEVKPKKKKKGDKDSKKKKKDSKKKKKDSKKKKKKKR